jgi:hypothetical protein
MSPLTQNKPLIWAVIAGLATAFIAFLIPGLRNLLGIVPLSLGQWGIIFGWALILLLFVELGKLVTNRGYRNLRKSSAG